MLSVTSTSSLTIRRSSTCSSELGCAQSIDQSHGCNNARVRLLRTDKLFTGHQQEGSLYFMQARFCPAATLRAGSANPQSLNRYSYVPNEPLRYTDHAPAA